MTWKFDLTFPLYFSKINEYYTRSRHFADACFWFFLTTYLSLRRIRQTVSIYLLFIFFACSRHHRQCKGSICDVMIVRWLSSSYNPWRFRQLGLIWFNDELWWISTALHTVDRYHSLSKLQLLHLVYEHKTQKGFLHFKCEERSDVIFKSLHINMPYNKHLAASIAVIYLEMFFQLTRDCLTRDTLICEALCRLKFEQLKQLARKSSLLIYKHSSLL